MLANPKPNQPVLIWYGAKTREWFPHLHDKVGVVVVASKGKPRNHLINVDGIEYVIPCGNLNRIN